MSWETQAQRLKWAQWTPGMTVGAADPQALRQGVVAAVPRLVSLEVKVAPSSDVTFPAEGTPPQWVLSAAPKG